MTNLADRYAAIKAEIDGLNRLRESAVQLAASDARDVVTRFGQLGVRKLDLAG